MAGRKAEKRQIRYTSAKEASEREDSSRGSKALKVPKGVTMSQIFKKKGVKKFDILPYVVGQGNKGADEGMVYYKRLYFVHDNVGIDNDKYCCLKANWGEPCPVCEHFYKLKQEGKAWDDIKVFRPKERELFNLIEKEHEDEGVQVLDFNKYQFGRILQELVNDSEKATEEEDNYTNFFHLEGGKSLHVTVIEEDFMGKPIGKPSNIVMKRRKDYPEEMLDKVFCLDDMIRKPSYEELDKAFHAVPKEEEEEDDDDAEDTPPRGRSNKPAKDEDEDEEDTDLPEDEDEDEEDKEPAAAVKYAVGDFVMYRGLECQIEKISKDGKTINVQDLENDDDYVVKDITKLSPVDKSDGEDEDDTPDHMKPKGKKPPTNGKAKPPAKDDEDDDEDDPEDPEDEDDDPPPPPAKKPRGKK